MKWKSILQTVFFVCLGPQAPALGDCESCMRRSIDIQKIEAADADKLCRWARGDEAVRCYSDAVRGPYKVPASIALSLCRFGQSRLICYADRIPKMDRSFQTDALFA